MTNFYTNSKMMDIHFMYDRVKSNASKAARLYHAAYPNRRVEECLAKFINAYVRPDSSNQFRCGRPRLIRIPAFEENILRTIEENPGISCRRSVLQKKSSHHTL